jgi:hypothetical protein
MPAVQQTFEVEVKAFMGMNTAQNPAELPLGAQALAKNAVMREIGTIGKRDGSKPVTSSAVGNTIKHLAQYKSSTIASPDLLAAAGTTLYKFNGTNALTAQTMTDALVTSDVYTEDFIDATLTSRLIIADTGDLKAYNGTEVKDIAPAPDDSSPAPANVLADINAKGNKYVWVYSGHVFVSPGTNEIFYSKRYYYNYFPEVQYFYLVRENDYVNGCGIAYNNVCLIPMRRGFAMLTGSNFDNFDASSFLNTVNGVIAPRSVVKLTYPNGTQTVAYLSDDGVHEIFDTGAIDTGVRQYSSRSLMAEKIDFPGVGFTEAELSAAYMEFDAETKLLKLWITRDTTYYCYVMDSRDGEWRIWTFPWDVKPSLRFNGDSYFAGSTGHLHKFDEDLYTDWNDSTMSTGTAVDFDVYSGLLSFEFSGHASYFDYLLIEAKQWTVTSKLDATLIYGAGSHEVPSALKNEIFVWGVSAWGEAQWANTEYTDIVNAAKNIIFKKKGKYFQVRMRNNRDEPVLVYKTKYSGRLSNK